MLLNFFKFSYNFENIFKKNRDCNRKIVNLITRKILACDVEFLVQNHAKNHNLIHHD